MALKIRAAGTAPYTVTIRDYSNNVIYSANNQLSDDITLPDNIENELLTKSASYTVVDSAGKTTVTKMDYVTLGLIKKYHVGRSVADGNFDNHITAILFGAEREEFTYCGVVYHQNDIEDDAAFLALINGGEYDHTKFYSSYLKGFDKVVSQAYASKITLRVGLNLIRSSHRLNNGTTRTMFYGPEAMSLRADGSLTYKLVDSPVPSEMVPSYGHPDIAVYGDTLLQAFARRYRAAINDGTILCIGLLFGTTGEAEYVVDQREPDGNHIFPSRGDFQPIIVDGFKAKFPQYANLNNFQIEAADLTNTALGRDWTWWLADVMRRYEWTRIDNLYANVPGITREKIFQVDVGSFIDALAPRRRTFNSFARLHPRIMVVKSNDNPNSGRDKFVMDHLSSMAKAFSCIAITEPSPTGDFTSQYARDVSTSMTIDAINSGVGISFVTANAWEVDDIRNRSGLRNMRIPKIKPEFIIVNGQKKANRYGHNLSQIYSTQNTDGWQVGYNSYKAANGLSLCDTVPIDDVKPN